MLNNYDGTYLIGKVSRFAQEKTVRKSDLIPFRRGATRRWRKMTT